MWIKVISPPTVEPITLEQARLHLRLDANADSPPAHPDDDLLAWQIPAAREWCEGFIEKALAPQTLELALDAFPPDAIELQRPPVQEIVSVKYLDGDGAEQTLPDNQYVLNNYHEPAWLVRVSGVTWPMAGSYINAVKVRYVAGYGIPGESPDTNPLPWVMRAAILLALGALYENRENSAAIKQEDIPLGARALLLQYRLRTSMA